MRTYINSAIVSVLLLLHTAGASGDCLVDNPNSVIEYYSSDVFIPLVTLTAIKVGNIEKAIEYLENELGIIADGLLSIRKENSHCLSKKERDRIDTALIQIYIVIDGVKPNTFKSETFSSLREIKELRRIIYENSKSKYDEFLHEISS